MMRHSAIFFLVMLFSSIANAATGESNPGPRSNDQVYFLFDEGTKAQKSGKIALAIENYQRILKDYPRFQQNFLVYRQIMTLYLELKKSVMACSYGKEALRLRPPTHDYFAIKVLLAECEIQLGNLSQANAIINEILHGNPDPATKTKVLLYKTEVLSLMGKHDQAVASLDAAKKDALYPDAELKVRTRACAAKKVEAKQEPLDFFHRKNLCFKEAVALAKNLPQRDAVRVWCDRYKEFENDLRRSKADAFTIQKLKKEMEETKLLAASWECR